MTIEPAIVNLNPMNQIARITDPNLQDVLFHRSMVCQSDHNRPILNSIVSEIDRRAVLCQCRVVCKGDLTGEVIATYIAN
jgi:hypothetical protein